MFSFGRDGMLASAKPGLPSLNLLRKITPKIFKKSLATGRVFDTFSAPFRLKSLMVSMVAGR
jgi:hypothetical protein